MKISFYQSGGIVMLSASFDRNRLRLSTGEKYDKSSQEQAIKLKRIELFLLNEYRKQQNDGKTPTPDSLKSAYMDFLGRKPQQVKVKSLHDHLAGFISDSPYALQTKALYTRMSELLKEFQVRLEFTDIDEQFYRDYVKFLQTKLGKDTSVGAHIKCLKHFLNDCFDKGISPCVEQKKRYFKVFSEDSDQVFLSQDEIKSIYDVRIEDGEVAYHRDLFVLSCYTGLRYSDWKNYTRENIIENGTILRTWTKKTGELVCIPLHPIAREILSRIFKSGYKFPSDAEMNRSLKKISGGINTVVSKSFTKGGKKVSEARFKSTMVSCHTSRRSFATNAYLAKVPVMDIMKFTSHKSDTSFKRYIRVGKLETAINNVNHPFFSPMASAK